MAAFENMKIKRSENMFKNLTWGDVDSIEVDKIIAAKSGKECSRYYLVSFKSWVREDFLASYNGLIEQYWKQQEQHEGDRTTNGSYSDEESHSDKENNHFPHVEVTNGNHLHSPSFEKLSPSYERDEVKLNGSSEQLELVENNDKLACSNELKVEVAMGEHNGNHNGDDQIDTEFDGLDEDVDCCDDVNDKELHDNQNGMVICKEEDHSSITSDENYEGEACIDSKHSNKENKEQDEIPQEKERDNFNAESEVVSDMSSETVDISMENNEPIKKSGDGPGPSVDSSLSDSDPSLRSATGFSDKTTSSCSDHPSPVFNERKSKKRKLKSLDDIVRKISGTSDQSNEKKICNDDLLTERLQTLDQTLADDKNDVAPIAHSEEKEQANFKSSSNSTSPAHDVNETTPQKSQRSNSSPSRSENVYWSSGKSFQKASMVSSRPFRCFTCETKFEHEDDLIMHQERYHKHATQNGSERGIPKEDYQRVYTCRHCGDVFDTIVALDQHRFTAHKGHRKYQKCKFCPTMYTDAEMLHRHEESHLLGRDLYPTENDHYPPPLIQDDGRNFPQYQRYGDRNSNGPVPPVEGHQKPRPKNGYYHTSDDGSRLRTPIRNLLGKMYNSQHEPPQHSPNGDRGQSFRKIPSMESVSRQYREFVRDTHGFPSHDVESPTSKKASPVDPEPPGFDGISNGEFKELLFNCPICDKPFGKKESFDHHFMAVHPNTPLYNCEFCRESFMSTDLFEQHMQLHMKEKLYQCHICGRSFPERENLRRHILIHTEASRYRCHFCSKVFAKDYQLNIHIREFHAHGKYERYIPKDDRFVDEGYHGSVNGNSSPSPVYEKLRSNEIPSRPHSMQNSRKDPFPNRRHYIDESKLYGYEPTIQTHVRPNVSSLAPMHRVPFDAKLHRTVDESQMNNQLLKMVPVIRPSHYSPGGPPSPKMVPSHVRSFQMKCSECDEEFTSQSLYEIHLLSHVKEVFTCKKCNKTFTDKSHFESHATTHESNKSHICPYCHRSFSMKGNLRRHIRIHTNEAPYVCPICSQQFRRSDGLKGHIKRHETMGESAPNDMIPSQVSAKAAS